MNLVCNITNNSVLSTLSTSSGDQGKKSNVISTLSNSNRKFIDLSNRKCITPSGQFENRNGNCHDKEDN